MPFHLTTTEARLASLDDSIKTLGYSDIATTCDALWLRGLRQERDQLVRQAEADAFEMEAQ